MSKETNKQIIDKKYIEILIILWLIGILIRVGIFLTTEYYVDGGEAVVGLMARYRFFHGIYECFKSKGLY